MKHNIKYWLERIRTSLHYRTIFAPHMDSLYRGYQQCRIKRIRKKQKIRVLFIVGEASMWKSEMLYKKMLEHPRFEPILGVTESLFVPGGKASLLEYARKQGYRFVDLDEKGNSISRIDPDIKLYYKPYDNNYRKGLYFDYHMKSLLCNIHYSFNFGGDSQSFRHEIRWYSWADFVENSAVVDAFRSSGRYYKNKIITGLPLQDYLSLPKESYKDPWKDCGAKKRIIYAPHHSFKGTNSNYVEYATFLDFGEYMLQLAQKYADRVQWVFKPHPSLYQKLLPVWGKERADAYYEKWKNLPNAQVELGAYYDIFRYSDAMIHDSQSFIGEYLYTGNPILFLEYEMQSAEQMHLSKFGYDAYLAHYHASKEQEIEQFVQNVILGVDPMKKIRGNYFEKYMRIPNGKTACDNIIDVILGND